MPEPHVVVIGSDRLYLSNHTKTLGIFSARMPSYFDPHHPRVVAEIAPGRGCGGGVLIGITDLARVEEGGGRRSQRRHDLPGANRKARA